MVRLSVIAACLILIGCASPQVVETTIITPTQRPDQLPQIPPGLDTPAIRNCLTLGGTVTAKAGSAPSSLCALPGGAVLDASQLYAETHPGG